MDSHIYFTCIFVNMILVGHTWYPNRRTKTRSVSQLQLQLYKVFPAVFHVIHLRCVQQIQSPLALQETNQSRRKQSCCVKMAHVNALLQDSRLMVCQSFGQSACGIYSPGSSFSLSLRVCNLDVSFYVLCLLASELQKPVKYYFVHFCTLMYQNFALPWLCFLKKLRELLCNYTYQNIKYKENKSCQTTVLLVCQHIGKGNGHFKHG